MGRSPWLDFPDDFAPEATVFNGGPDRQKQISFTNTHFLTASRFVSKKASKINSIDDLKGKSVVSTSGTTNIKQLTEANAARNLGILMRSVILAIAEERGPGHSTIVLAALFLLQAMRADLDRHAAGERARVADRVEDAALTRLGGQR